jgi:hypothetical protein
MHWFFHSSVCIGTRALALGRSMAISFSVAIDVGPANHRATSF